MVNAKKMTVELVYALPNEQKLITMQLDQPCAIREAIDTSGILELYPEIDLNNNKVGIFSRIAKLDQSLRDGDRIEIYRPLLIDPKEVRKQRAIKAKVRKN